MITKKENNINLRNMSAQLEYKERTIMKRKIYFLEMQITEGSKRESLLRRENDQLKKALDEVTQDKKNGRGKQLEAKLEAQEREHDYLRHKYNEQQAKLDQITSFLGEKYQQELHRVYQLAEQRVQRAKEQSRTEIEFYERKLHEYEKTIERYSRLCQNSVIPTSDRPLSTLMLDTSASSFMTGSIQGTNRRYELNNSNSSIHLQSFSTIIPEANISASRHDIPMKRSTKNQHASKKEPSLLLSESDLYMVSMGRHTSYIGYPRYSINRSKSIMLLDADCTSKKKQKTIATSLFCTTCSKEYPPNYYYRHLKGCEDNAQYIRELLAKRETLSKQIDEINYKGRSAEELYDVVVVLKKRKEPPTTSRVSMTSRPRLR